MAIGIDCGTMFLVKSEVDPLGEGVGFSKQRNVFLQASSSEDTEQTLKENGWSYAKHNENYYILGDDALKLKNLLTIRARPEDSGIVIAQVGELRRPMQNGILNTSEEKLSIAIIQKLLANLAGKPRTPQETLCFCSPGDPVDSNLSVIFHRTILTNFFKTLGYDVECIPEALAIIFSERPVAEDEDGEAPFSGIAISCLPAGQKVITDKGFKNIEEVDNNDLVLTKNGEWKKVIQPTSREHVGEIITIWAYGHGSITTTDDHLIWCKRDEKWQWIPSRDVKIGDYIMQPWIRNYDTSRRLYAYWSERITNSEPIKTQKEITGEMAEIIGYFLGDGHIEQHDQCIAWTFADHEQGNIDRLKELCSNVFGKQCSENSHSENDVRLKLYHKGFASWLKKNCYNDDKQKQIPIQIQEMSDTLIMHMIRGLVMSDGWFDNNGFRFGNTSSSLAQFVFLGAQKLGMLPSLNVREPRQGENPVDDAGRCISGKLQEYTVSCGGLHSEWFVNWMMNPKKVASKSFIDGQSVARVNKIQKESFTGTVYDLVVDDDSHSFCLPGFAIHNCGAGMCNICFAWKKMPLISFSVARSGDWIDQESARVAGIDRAAMTRFKESCFSLDEVDYSDMRQAALDIFYQQMIEHALKNFAQKFNQLDSNIQAPLEIVLAGGTASIPGFLNKFKTVLQELELPFRIKDVRMAGQPLYAVANGCLVKALSSENKKKSGVETKEPAHQSPKKKVT